MNKKTHISNEKYEESPEIMVQKEDLLVVQRGSTIGKITIVDRDIGKATINPSMILIKNIEINPRFLYYWLCGSYIQKNLCDSMSRTGQPMISQAQVKKLLVPFPPLSEQQKIASILSKVDSQVQDNQNYLTKLQELKKGLMQDLLTGKVRVCV